MNFNDSEKENIKGRFDSSLRILSSLFLSYKCFYYLLGKIMLQSYESGFFSEQNSKMFFIMTKIEDSFKYVPER